MREKNGSPPKFSHHRRVKRADGRATDAQRHLVLRHVSRISVWRYVRPFVCNNHYSLCKRNRIGTFACDDSLPQRLAAVSLMERPMSGHRLFGTPGQFSKQGLNSGPIEVDVEYRPYGPCITNITASHLKLDNEKSAVTTGPMARVDALRPAR